MALFIFLKFILVRLFDLNLRPIASDFFVNGGIRRIGIEMKKRPNMGGIPEVLGKIQFGPLTFKIT